MHGILYVCEIKVFINPEKKEKPPNDLLYY